jgi:hypothetical protein
MMIRALMAGLLLISPLLATADIGQIKSVSGEVWVVRGGERIAAERGTRLNAEDVIETGATGRVGLMLHDNTRMSAGPNSRIGLDRFHFDPTTHDGKSVTSISKGTLSIISGQLAKHSKDAVTVKTPSSVLAVRGTRFLVQVD